MSFSASKFLVSKNMVFSFFALSFSAFRVLARDFLRLQALENLYLLVFTVALANKTESSSFLEMTFVAEDFEVSDKLFCEGFNRESRFQNLTRIETLQFSSANTLR